jgi:uncharacterized protein (DUF2132 family)
MKAPLPDLFDRDKTFAPAAQALRSRKREAFCQQVAGECWGNNTEAYCRAFGATDRDAAGASAARLSRDPAVKARIAFLREESIARMGVDRAYILDKRKFIAEHGRNMADRLHALDAMEKSLGLDAPLKIEIEQNVSLSGIAGVVKIEDAAQFARVMEAVRAAREAGNAKPADVIEAQDPPLP